MNIHDCALEMAKAASAEGSVSEPEGGQPLRVCAPAPMRLQEVAPIEDRDRVSIEWFSLEASRFGWEYGLDLDPFGLAFDPKGVPPGK